MTIKRLKVVHLVFIAVAIIQTAIFAYSGCTAQSSERYGCVELKRSYPSAESWSDCWPRPLERYVMLANLPVFIVTTTATWILGAKLKISQVAFFYLFNALAMLLFWNLVGMAFAKRKAPQQAEPHMR